MGVFLRGTSRALTTHDDELRNRTAFSRILRFVEAEQLSGIVVNPGIRKP